MKNKYFFQSCSSVWFYYSAKCIRLLRYPELYFLRRYFDNNWGWFYYFSFLLTQILACIFHIYHFIFCLISSDLGVEVFFLMCISMFIIAGTLPNNKIQFYTSFSFLFLWSYYSNVDNYSIAIFFLFHLSKSRNHIFENQSLWESMTLMYTRLCLQTKLSYFIRSIKICYLINDDDGCTYSMMAVLWMRIESCQKWT